MRSNASTNEQTHRIRTHLKTYCLIASAINSTETSTVCVVVFFPIFICCCCWRWCCCFEVVVRSNTTFSVAALHPGGGNSHVIINYLGKHQCVRNQQITRLRHKVREANALFGEVNEVLPRKNAKLESIKKKEFQKEN